MELLQLKKYGDITKVLYPVKAKKPVPGSNQVLIEVKAIALNPIDIKIANGDLKAILPSILSKPKLGFDVSGTIKQIGNKVKDFNIGDEVYVRLPLHKGSGFSKSVIAELRHIALKPGNITFEEAAAIPLVGLTSMQAISTYAKAETGQHILIDSGSGGVGTFAVQYANNLGLHVTTVTSHRNETFVKNLGADRVIRYDMESFLDDGVKYDIVFNIIGNFNPFKSILATKKGGVVVSIGGPPDIRFLPKIKGNIIQKVLLFLLFGFISLPIRLFAWGKGVRYYRFLTTSNGEQLDAIKGLIEKGKIRPIVDKIYALDKHKKAFEYHRVKGKLILNEIK